MADKNVAIRLAVVGGKAVREEFVQIGREGKGALSGIAGASGGARRAMGEVSSAARAMRGAVQNTGYQVQDFAVQVAAGTSASRALAQQLPQLLSGFGLFGVLAGTAAAVLIPLTSGLFAAGAEGEKLDDSLTGLERSTRAYQIAMQNAAIPLDQLRAKFGEQAEAVRGVYQAQLQLAKLDLAKDMRNLNEGIGETLGGMIGALAKLDDARRQMAAQAATDIPTGAGAIGVDLIAKGQEQIRKEFGMTEEQARIVKAAIDDLGKSTGPVETQAALGRLYDELLKVAGEYKGLGDPANEAAKAIDALLRKVTTAQLQMIDVGGTDMSAGIIAATRATDELIARLERAVATGAAAQQAARDLANRSLDYSPAGIALRKYGGRGGSADQTALSGDLASPEEQLKGYLYRTQVPKTVHAARGGGGGMSQAQRDANKMVEEAQRVTEAARTETEKYNDEVARLQELLSKGLITQETFDRSISGLKDKFKAAGSAAQQMGADIGGALNDIIVKGEDAREVISNLLQSFASQALNSGWSTISSILFGGAGASGGATGSVADLMGGSSFLGGWAKGGIFDGGRVLPFAKGGIFDSPVLFPMRGGAGLMGEAGPEAIMPLARGADGRLGVRSDGLGGGGVTVQVSVNVDARGAVDGVAAQVSEAVRAQIPAIVRQSVAGVAAARKRGYPV